MKFLPLRSPALPLALILLTLIPLSLYPLRERAMLPSIPLSEDAFYVFSVVRSVAEGHGITYERGLQTNGFQPLVAALYVPFWWAAPDNTLGPLRGVLVLNMLFHLLPGFFVGLLAWRLSASRVAAWLAAALWITSYFIFGHTACGLETGLTAIFFAASLCYAFKHSIALQSGTSPMREIVLGLLLGFTVLSRIDSALVCVTISIFLAWSQRARGLAAIRPFFTVGFVSFVISSPWWWYNHHFFGSIMPQSGVAERLDHSTALNLQVAFMTLIRGTLLQGPFLLSLRDMFLPLTVIWIATLIFFLLHRRLFALPAEIKPWLAPLIAFYALMASYYIFVHGAPYFFDRYMVPVYILWTALLGTFLFRLFEKWQASTLRLAVPAFLALFALVGLALHAKEILRPSLIWTYRDMQLGLLMAHNVGPDQTVGAFSMGAVGYLHRNVINLDGKMDVNSLQARVDGTLPQFILDSDIDYLCDLRGFATEFFGPTGESAHFTPIAENETAVLWQRVP